MVRVAAIASVLALAPWAVSLPGAEGPAGATLVERFLSATETPLTQYRAIRHIEGRNLRFNAAATMTVVTELTPESGFSYIVLDEQGSDYIRNRAMHPLLESERQMTGDESGARYAFSPENYEMQDGQALALEEGLLALVVTPRRREVGLVDGRLILAADTGDLVRVEGRFAKNPSFWTTRVDFVREYARLNGVRVPVRVESTASIRMAGTSTLSMVYEYESINGRPVTPTGRLVATSTR
jgi:hypothetical protein